MPGNAESRGDTVVARLHSASGFQSSDLTWGVQTRDRWLTGLHVLPRQAVRTHARTLMWAHTCTCGHSCRLSHSMTLMLLANLEPSQMREWWRAHLQCRKHKRLGLDPWVGKIPWRRKRQPTPVFLPGEFQGQKSLVGYSPWGSQESDTTQWLRTPAAILWALDSHWP